MLKRLQSWLKVAPARLVNCLAYAMLGLAVILIVIGAIVLLTGQAGGLNNWLANSALTSLVRRCITRVLAQR